MLKNPRCHSHSHPPLLLSYLSLPYSFSPRVNFSFFSAIFFSFEDLLMSRAFNEGMFSLFSLLQVKATSQISIPNSFPFLVVFFFSPSFLLCKTTSPHPRIQNSKFKS
ncbi:hypothetical protein HanXRQr2_Chr10g0420101 [Helianthus annuus]|uniref:Uncharacterized protein n=1 Tax=Helianthus annuus TaxID=4232 RepID=A0A251TGA1_HELAN|nr:hypothetical protein HanXRQr2_Chr10g0420101 [Helianthus annuus]KAJ0528497.1 hypothetical protein HanHA89_Chr10g0367061 [Helianthus annuus]